MSKITLNNVADLTQTTTAATTINNNSNTVQVAFDNTLSRDGTAPNQMGANLDMNNNQIINLPSPSGANSPLRVQDASILNGAGTITVSNLPPAGLQGQILTKNTNANYDVSWGPTLVKATPLSTDNLMLSDTAAGNTLKTVSIASLPVLQNMNVQKFTASGTYTPTAGMMFCLIECQAGGGGGGGCAAQSSAGQNGAGGGGAGGYSRRLVNAATIGLSQVVTVGAAGGGGAAGNNNGAAGGNSSVGGICIANGGGGGIGAPTSGNGVASAGGAAGTGDLTIAGGWGSQGYPNPVTSANGFWATGGPGGSSVFGAGGPGISAGQNGIAAVGFGSGGSGGSDFNIGNTARSGGAGAPGIVIITEFCNQ